MSVSFWNDRYEAETYGYGVEPADWLRQQGWRLATGMTALVPADGEGRNGVWLAGLGLDVLSVDQSSAGLRKAERLAAEKGVTIRTQQADLGTWAWPVATFDLVVLIFAHLPPAVRQVAHRAAAAALKPGGLLVLEAFRPAQLGNPSGGPRDDAMMYDAAILQADFAGLEILELLEGKVRLNEGQYHQGMGEVVRLLARHP